MPIPSNVATVTVTGYWTNSDSGGPATGTVTFTPNAVLQDGTSAPANIVLPKPQAAALVNGAISVQLMATDATALSPSGWVYTVSENIAGQASNRTYQLQFPAAQTPVDLSTKAPLVSPPALVGYVATSAVGAVSGVASLDATRNVPLAQLGNAPTGTGVPSGTVVAETTYGQASAAGTATNYSRGDHTHGTPSTPTPAGIGAAVKPTMRKAYITTGDITMPAYAVWTAIPGLELQLPAAVGDYVEIAPSFMHNSAGQDFYDLAALVGTGIVRRSSTGTASATANGEGDPALYSNPGTFRTSGATFDFVVTSGDLDTGNIRFVLIARGTGGSKVFASTNYPYRWRAINHGPVN